METQSGRSPANQSNKRTRINVRNGAPYQLPPSIEANVAFIEPDRSLVYPVNRDTPAISSDAQAARPATGPPMIVLNNGCLNESSISYSPMASQTRSQPPNVSLAIEGRRALLAPTQMLHGTAVPMPASNNTSFVRQLPSANETIVLSDSSVDERGKN